MVDVTPEGSAAPVFSVEAPSVGGVPPIVPPSVAELRAEAYRVEADPLFFKWQRGEASEQDWLDAVQSIKNRFPEEETPWI